MSRFNTGNPIGSADPRDRDDNSKNLDEAVNDLNSETWTDRFGVERLTIQGALNRFNDVIIAGGQIFESEEVGRDAVQDGQYYYVVSDDPDVSRELWRRIGGDNSEFIASDPSAELIRSQGLYADAQRSISQELLNALTAAPRANVFDLSNSFTFGLNEAGNVSSVVPVVGNVALSGGSEPPTLLTQENGLTGVGQPLGVVGRQRLFTETPLIQDYPCTLLISQRTTGAEGPRSVFWQRGGGGAGNIQITSNRRVVDGSPSTFYHVLSVFISGAVFPDGSNSVNVAWPIGRGNTLAVVLREQEEGSEVWANGLKVTAFTAPPSILQENSYLMGDPNAASTADGVEMGRCIVVDEALSGDALRQAGEWVAQGVGGEWISPLITTDDGIETALSSVVIRHLPKSAQPFFSDAGEYAPILYAKQPDLRLRPASTIKTLTALVVADWNDDLDAIVTIEEGDIAGGSGGNLGAGDQVSVIGLLNNLILVSSNTSANALARFTGQIINTETGGAGDPWVRFVEAMNDKAASIGMVNSAITNPSGLNVGTMRLTADDLSKLLIAAVASPVVDELMRARHYTMHVSGVDVEIAITTDFSNDVYSHMLHRKGGNLSGSWGSVSTYVATFLAPNGDLIAASAMWDGASSGGAQGALYDVVMQVMEAVGWPRLLSPVNPRLIAPSVLAASIANIVSGYDSSVFDFNQSGAYLTTTPAKDGDAAPRVASLTDSAVLASINNQNPPVIGSFKGSLLTVSSEGSSGYVSQKPLLQSLPASIAFSMQSPPDNQAYALFQSSAGAEGRLQLVVNGEFDGSLLQTRPGKVQLFVGGATGGAGVDEQPLAGDYVAGQPVTGVVVLRQAGEASEVWLDGRMVDTFEMPQSLFLGPSQLVRNTVPEDSTVSYSKLLVSHQALSRDQVAVVGEWLAQGYSREWDSPGYLNNDLLSAHGAIVYRVSNEPAIIADYPESTILYEKGPTSKLMPASLTKVMTSMVMLDYISDLSETMTVIESDATGGSGNNLNTGDVISYQQALYNMMLPSSNVTTTVVARNVGEIILDGAAGDPIERFVEEMNRKAALLSMSDTVFNNASGLSSAGQVTSARDMGRMGLSALSYPDILDVWGSVTHELVITGPDARTVTINHSAQNMGDEGILGGKTGTLPGGAAANLLEYVALPGGETAIAVVMLTGTDTRYDDMSNMLSYVRGLYRWPVIQGE